MSKRNKDSNWFNTLNQYKTECEKCFIVWDSFYIRLVCISLFWYDRRLNDWPCTQCACALNENGMNDKFSIWKICKMFVAFFFFPSSMSVDFTSALCTVRIEHHVLSLMVKMVKNINMSAALAFQIDLYGAFEFAIKNHS